MLSFSQRKGIKPIRDKMQIDTMEERLHIRLWNVITNHCWNPIVKSNFDFGEFFEGLLKIVWDDYFNWATDTIHRALIVNIQKIREQYFNFDWDEVYSFVEFLANNYPASIKPFSENFIKACNKVLKSEMSAYRFVETKIVQITSEEEISEIEKVLQSTIDPIKIHIKCALEHLSDRESPDYRNSIKESISAVETICQKITNNKKSTLGKALDKIEKEDKVKLHPALKSSFDKLYGYSSDADGIRHALLDEPNLDFEDAKFMLVSCSAFINYLLEKASKAGIKI